MSHSPSATMVVRQLQVGYGQSLTVSIPHLEIAPGQVYGLIGPNGVGKSTVLKALVGIIPARGTIEIAGRPLRQIPARERATLMGYLSQDAISATGFSGREIVAMGRYARQGRFNALSAADEAAIDAALQLCHATEWADRPSAHTSGGERQLIGLARTLAQDPRVLFLDEPISALDLRHETAVLTMLRTWVAQDPRRSVVVVLHSLNLAARFCDELVLLGRGRDGPAGIISAGPVSQVLHAEHIAQAYGIAVDIRRHPVTGSLDITAL